MINMYILEVNTADNIQSWAPSPRDIHTHTPFKFKSQQGTHTVHLFLPTQER